MNSRRDFLMKSSLATMAALTAPSILNAADSTIPSESGSFDKKHKLSILSYTFNGMVGRGMQDIFGYFETCKYRYNLDAADLWGGHLKDFRERYDKGTYIPFEEEWIAKVKEALDERELCIPNIAADGCHVITFDPERTELQYKNAKEHLKLAKMLGVGFVRFDSGPSFQMPDGRSDWTNEEFDFIVKRYKEYAQYAYDNGFKVGAENHMGPSGVWKNLKKLYDAVNHPGFGVCIHIGGYRGATPEETVELDKESAKIAVHTHIPMNIINGPLEEKMNNLRNAGYQGYYSVEVPGGRGENPYQNAAYALAKVRAVFSKWDQEDAKAQTQDKAK
jgi:sugar phosphate isomerase/epimerase